MTNIIFSTLSIAMSSWLLIMYFSLQPNSPLNSLWLIRLTVFLATQMSFLILIFAHTLPSENLRPKGAFLAILSMVTVGVCGLTLSPLVFESVQIVDNFPQPSPGPGIAVFGIYIIVTTFLSISTLFKKSRSKVENESKQAGFVMTGILLMYGFLFATVLLPVAITKSTTFVPFFPMYSILFTGLTAYATVRHNLLQLKVLAVEALTILVWIVLFSKLFVTQSPGERAVDLLIFLALVVLGYLLIKTVTKEIEQRAKLQELTEKLKELDARKDEFLNVAAHELRAPMTAIKGYISMLLDGDVGKLPDPAVDYLKVALQSNDRLIRLVNNLLNASRIEEGRQVYQMGIMNLISVTKLVFDEFRFTAQEKKLSITLDVPPNPIVDTVYVDRDRIHEVISNLISNAIKYTDQGAIVAKISTPKPGIIRFEITDTGKGISREDQTKLFQKYYRVESTIGRTIGTGLGLYISKLLVEKFGGQIGFSSEVGKGSTFWFELPVTSTADKSHILV